MAAPARSRSTGKGRFYVDARGEAYWSVTTILKAVPKDALVYWSAKEAAVCAVDNIPRIKAILGDDGDGRDAAIAWVKGACWRSSGKKMELGTTIHEVVEALVVDGPMPAVPPEAEAFMDSFLRFAVEWDPGWEASEFSVFNRTEKYAGTLDLIATLDGRRMLLDVKTGKCPTDSSGRCVGAYPETALQLAAYRHAEFLELRDGREIPMPQIDGGAVLHLAPDHYTLVELQCDEPIFTAFKYVREVYRWANETSKTVIGAPLRAPLTQGAS